MNLKITGLMLLLLFFNIQNSLEENFSFISLSLIFDSELLLLLLLLFISSSNIEFFKFDLSSTISRLWSLSNSF